MYSGGTNDRHRAVVHSQGADNEPNQPDEPAIYPILNLTFVRLKCIRSLKRDVGIDHDQGFEGMGLSANRYRG